MTVITAPKVPISLSIYNFPPLPIKNVQLICCDFYTSFEKQKNVIEICYLDPIVLMHSSKANKEDYR